MVASLAHINDEDVKEISTMLSICSGASLIEDVQDIEMSSPVGMNILKLPSMLDLLDIF